MSELEPERIAENDLFSGIPLPILGDFLEQGALKRFSPETVIIDEGSDEGGLYYILEGEVDVTKGADHLYVNTLKAGECFGEMSLFSTASASANVVAKDSVEVYFFSEEIIDDFIRHEHTFTKKFLQNIIKRLCIRLRETTDTLFKIRAEGDFEDEYTTLLEELDVEHL